ncbi:hypothetical protein [Palleronia sp.]|uniref:hypothetical protein n=1 Tax=Palleronia sp. TaxID=1940284 RepID=UPI0035C7BC03
MTSSLAWITTGTLAAAAVVVVVAGRASVSVSNILAFAALTAASYLLASVPEGYMTPWLSVYAFLFLSIVFPAARLIGMRVAGALVLVTPVLWFAFQQIEPALLDPATGRLPPILVTGLVVVAGWFVTFAIQEFRAEQARRSQAAETLTAFGAEISDALKGAIDAHGVGRHTRIIAETSRIESGEGDGPYHPFVARPNTTVVFDAMSDRLATLPQKAVFEIVSFYTLYRDLATMVDDLNSDAFRDMPPRRRREQFERFAGMWRDADRQGHSALKAINAELPWHSPRISIPVIESSRQAESA